MYFNRKRVAPKSTKDLLNGLLCGLPRNGIMISYTHRGGDVEYKKKIDYSMYGPSEVRRMARLIPCRWLDIDNLLPGMDVTTACVQAVANARFGIAFVDLAYIDSEACRVELEALLGGDTTNITAADPRLQTTDEGKARSAVVKTEEGKPRIQTKPHIILLYPNVVSQMKDSDFDRVAEEPCRTRCLKLLNNAFREQSACNADNTAATLYQMTHDDDHLLKEHPGEFLFKILLTTGALKKELAIYSPAIFHEWKGTGFFFSENSQKKNYPATSQRVGGLSFLLSLVAFPVVASGAPYQDPSTIGLVIGLYLVFCLAIFWPTLIFMTRRMVGPFFPDSAFNDPASLMVCLKSLGITDVFDVQLGSLEDNPMDRKRYEKLAEYGIINIITGPTDVRCSGGRRLVFVQGSKFKGGKAKPMSKEDQDAGSMEVIWVTSDFKVGSLPNDMKNRKIHKVYRKKWIDYDIVTCIMLLFALKHQAITDSTCEGVTMWADASDGLSKLNNEEELMAQRENFWAGSH